MPNGWSYKKGGKGKGWGPGFPHRRLRQVIESYLQPLLFNGIQNTLSERSHALWQSLGQSSKSGMPMRFYVSTRVGNTNLVVSSTNTDVRSCPVGGERDESVEGVAIESKSPVFSNHVNGCSVIFNLAGEKLGRVSTAALILPRDEKHAAQWVYANPILEVSDTLSPDAQIVGVLGVEGDDDRSYGVFTNSVFQKEVESISCELEPYLSVLSSLKRSDSL